METIGQIQEGDGETLQVIISEMPPIHCNKQNLIEASDYFEAMLTRGFRESELGAANFDLHDWREEYYAFFCWISSGANLLKVLNMKSLLFFIIISNYFQLKESYFRMINMYASGIKLQDESLMKFTENYWSFRYIPFETMTTIVMGNQSANFNSELIKYILAWIDEGYFEDRESLESSEHFHEARGFLRTVSSWIPNNLSDFLAITEKYPFAAEAIDLIMLLKHMKPICFCSRFTPQILIKFTEERDLRKMGVKMGFLGG